jgi:hypothetical protein
MMIQESLLYSWNLEMKSQVTDFGRCRGIHATGSSSATGDMNISENPLFELRFIHILVLTLPTHQGRAGTGAEPANRKSRRIQPLGLTRQEYLSLGNVLLVT